MRSFRENTTVLMTADTHSALPVANARDELFWKTKKASSTSVEHRAPPPGLYAPAASAPELPTLGDNKETGRLTFGETREELDDDKDEGPIEEEEEEEEDDEETGATGSRPSIKSIEAPATPSSIISSKAIAF
jgi:hypothetical protein